MKKLRSGFTLIELLVVIAIIAILATVVIINVTGARAKANDAKVLSDLETSNKSAAACAVDGGTVASPVNEGVTSLCTNGGIGGSWVALSVANTPSALWTYCTSSISPNPTPCENFSAFSSGAYYYIAYNTDDMSKLINLKPTGVTKN